MSKTSKKVPPAKGQSSLFSFFTKKTAPAPPEPEPEPQPEAREAPSAPLRAPAPPAVEKKPAYVVMEDDKSLYVGRAVRVFWPNEKQWFSGVVESYSADENTHSVLYEDGDQEDLCLDREKVWRYCVLYFLNLSSCGLCVSFFYYCCSFVDVFSLSSLTQNLAIKNVEMLKMSPREPLMLPRKKVI